uniref:Kinesin-like protein n=1 Tax=Globodera pallida TaxID=36090 RepID=A0A183CMA8_GLOPA
MEHQKLSGREEEHVKVAVRCRPLSQQEQQQGHRTVVQTDEHAKSVAVAQPDSRNELLKCYTFDEVFGPEAVQATVYNSLCRPIVENVLKGYNGTIFAYGQTGTGKTYTMSGNDGQADGVTQNAFAHIFDHIAKCHQDKRFLVRISYMEIYNEEARDLLAKQPADAHRHHSLEIKERADIGVYVKDLLNVTVASAEQCLRIMQFGNANRHTGRTSMNEQSSRSHAIFTVTIECSEMVDGDGRQLLTQGKLHLVDLAGSERQSKTHSVGDRLKEASKINLSLSTLGNVISALVDTKNPHIPYRNSKLTRILQDSLGGNSKTAMIANIGPASYNYDETIGTLRYANRAKQIRNVARINEDPKDALLRRFQEEIEQLKKQLEENAEAISDTEEAAVAEMGGFDEEADELQKHQQQQQHAPHHHHNHQFERIREIEESIERGKRKLQGSERQSKTHSVGDRLKEASKINLSLSTLGNVISALVDTKNPHIPYRNSKLTRILQDSLGGNSKTAMIANIGPASYNYDETIGTLRYANRAKQIRNVARINEDPKDALLRRFQEEIEQLKKQLEENAEAISDTEEAAVAEMGGFDEEADELQKHQQQQHTPHHHHNHQFERIREIEESIERGKRKLQEEHGLKEAERHKLADDLLRREEELTRNKRERDKLLQKLGTIERQIIVGGENMLEKVEIQAKLLEESNRDLERARQDELALQTRFRNQQAEQCDIGEQYNTLQEEAQGLNKKLKKVWTQYMQAKAELTDIEVEHQREMEALLESVRQLQRELLYSMLVIDQFIPEERVRYIEKFVHWNEEIGDWQLRCIVSLCRQQYS